MAALVGSIREKRKGPERYQTLGACRGENVPSMGGPGPLGQPSQRSSFESTASQPFPRMVGRHGDEGRGSPPPPLEPTRSALPAIGRAFSPRCTLNGGTSRIRTSVASPLTRLATERNRPLCQRSAKPALSGGGHSPWWRGCPWAVPRMPTESYLIRGTSSIDGTQGRSSGFLALGSPACAARPPISARARPCPPSRLTRCPSSRASRGVPC